MKQVRIVDISGRIHSFQCEKIVIGKDSYVCAISNTHNIEVVRQNIVSFETSEV